MGTARSIAVVIGGGEITLPSARAHAGFDLVIAADSGVDAALAAGLTPHLVVGDLDSISDAGRRWTAEHGVPVEQHPADKDRTDTALALHRAAGLGSGSLTLLGPGSSDRFDHLLGALVALGDPVLAAFGSVDARLGGTVAHVLHPGHRVTVERGCCEVFSLLTLHGRCTGVSVTGARWPLSDTTVEVASTLGISNESTGAPVEVKVGTGVLTVIVPEVAS